MSPPPFVPEGVSFEPPGEVLVELDADGVVRAVERPEWAGDGGPRPGEPITRSLSLELDTLPALLERTAAEGRSERSLGRLVGAGELRPVTVLVTPLPRRPGRGGKGDDDDGEQGRGWLLALQPDSDLPTRLLAAAPGILVQAVEQMSVGLTLTDADGRIVYANRAEAAMHGDAPEDLIGRLARELGVAGDARPPGSSVPPPSPWDRRRLNRRRDGSVFPVRLISDDVRDASGRVLGRVTVCEDVTERARLDRMQEEFVTVVSHELRTPLTSILGCLALLGRDNAPPERSAEALAIAERNGRLLLGLVSDLLDLERAVSGTLKIERTAVPVAAVLEAAAGRAERGGQTDDAGRDPASRRIVVDRAGLEPEDGETPLTLLADRQRLVQVLGLLLSNALKFSPAGSPVLLGARRGPTHTTLVVTDRGPGIPGAFRHRLFEPFLLADASTTRRTAGTGLGLALARALTERMGGTLELAAEDSDPPPGAGTTLLLTLPNG